MKEARGIGLVLQLGWVVAFSVLLPLAAGIWLDRRLHTPPLFILIGAFVGIVAGTFNAVRIASRSLDALGQAGQVDTGNEELTTGREDESHE